MLIHSTIVELFNFELPKMSKKRPNGVRKRQLLFGNNNCTNTTDYILPFPVPVQTDSGLEILRLGIWNHRVQNALAKEFHLPVYELECVLVLSLDCPSSASELAEELGVRSSSLSKLLNRLEGRGLVERAIERSDRRVERITLAPAGIMLAENAIRRVMEISTAMLERLPYERRPQFLECVRLITSTKVPEDTQLHPSHDEPMD